MKAAAPCQTCGLMMRPANTKAADWPGTRQRATSTACHSCHRSSLGRRFRLTSAQVEWALADARRIREKEEAR